MIFTSKVEGLEIRGKEERDGKKGKFLIVRFDDSTGERLEFIDRDEDRFDKYEKGKTCDIWLKITNNSKYTNFVIVDMRYA